MMKFNTWVFPFDFLYSSFDILRFSFFLTSALVEEKPKRESP